MPVQEVDARSDLSRVARAEASQALTRRDYVIIAVVSLVLTVAFVEPYGSLNQATYLLDPLRRAMPELYRRDWFVSDTPPYLPVFGWLAQMLFRIDPEGPTAVIAAHVVVTLATYAALAWLVATVARGWRAFVVVAAFVAMTTGHSMGGSYVLVGYLQPSSLATLGWIAALAALARGRYIACGVALALGGALHANFLVLGLPVFGATALALRASWRELAKLLAPQLVVLAAFAPSLAGAAGPSAEAVRVLVDFHAPGHYNGARLAAYIPELVGWQIAAFAAVRMLEPTRETRVLWRFSLACSGIAIVTALAVMLPPLESLTQARWSRIAPFGQLACQVLIAAALVRRTTRPELWIAALIVVAVPLEARHAHLAWWIVLALAALLAAALVAPPRIVASALPAIAIAAALWASPHGSGLTTTPAAGPGELALETWAREHTPVDALFVAPPQLGRFRLLARRAVIADTKSPPLRPDLLVAWYHRLCALVEVDRAASAAEIETRYVALAPDQLARVAHAFGADYIVVPAATHLPGAPAYANDDWAVYASGTPSSP
jgi:hypothetical protein